MPQRKDKDWLNGYKNKTPTYVVYKKPTSKRDTYTPVPGILQARTLEWVAISFSNA